jgi:hypothetical protein
MNMYQLLCARQTVGRLGALLSSWDSTAEDQTRLILEEAHSRVEPVLLMQLKMLAGLHLPFLGDMSCSSSGGGGTILCSHSLDNEPTPPYAVAYSQVSFQLLLTVNSEELLLAETSSGEVCPCPVRRMT